jgi:hypothetical protein
MSLAGSGSHPIVDVQAWRSASEVASGVISAVTDGVTRKTTCVERVVTSKAFHDRGDY